MAKEYEVLEKSFISGRILDAGEKIIYDGEAGSNLRLVDSSSGDVQVGGVSGPEDEGIEKLREEYETLFGEKPHFNTGAKTLKEKIDERRKELGV